MFSVVVLDNEENFLEFLDTDLLEATETHEIGGLRSFEYLPAKHTFQTLPIFPYFTQLNTSGFFFKKSCEDIILTPKI